MCMEVRVRPALSAGEMQHETQKEVSQRVTRLKYLVVRVQGRCSQPPPAAFNLTEPVPLGACAILVIEDGLDVPLGTHHLWLDSLYFRIATPGTRESAVLLLHVRLRPLANQKPP